MGFLAHAHHLSLSLSRSCKPLCLKLLQPITHSNQKPEMGKQKVVIKVPMNEPKYFCWGFERPFFFFERPFHSNKTKAMKIAVGVPGVESAALAGQDKNQLEVVGDGIDAVGLTTLLRKNVGYSELVSVGPVPEKKDDPKKNEATAPVPVVGYYPNPYPYGAGQVYEIRDQNPCSIM